MFIIDAAPKDYGFDLHNSGHDYRGLTVITNPCLKDLQFYKVKDAFSAFQELSMYLGSQLCPKPEIDDVADKFKITGHGFDAKFSFRNPIKL